MWQNFLEASVQMRYALRVGRLGRANELYVELVDLCPVTFVSSHAENLIEKPSVQIMYAQV